MHYAAHLTKHGHIKAESELSCRRNSHPLNRKERVSLTLNMNERIWGHTDKTRKCDIESLPCTVCSRCGLPSSAPATSGGEGIFSKSGATKGDCLTLVDKDKIYLTVNQWLYIFYSFRSSLEQECLGDRNRKMEGKVILKKLSVNSV